MKEKKPQSFVLSRNTLFDKSTGLTLYGLQNKKFISTGAIQFQCVWKNSHYRGK